MKRLQFIAALFGVGAAGQDDVCTPVAGQMQSFKKTRPCSVINGQCPLCGTTAPPWSRLTSLGPPYTTAPCGPLNSTEVCFQGTVKPFGATEKVVRCKTCNTAFWQDAESQGGTK